MGSRVIKKGDVGLGDIDPDTGFSDVTVASKRPKIITADAAVAKTDAQSIRKRAKSEAGDIVGSAQGEAENLLEGARAEAEKLRQQGYDEGLETGRVEGSAKLAEVIATTSARLQQIEAQAIPQLKDLAVRIARKIIGRELEFHPDAVIDIIKTALAEKARQRREIFLRVNPEDMQMIRERKEDLLEVLSRCKEIGIREDPEVARHGVIIETEAGTIDAQLETQLAVFERVLKDVD